MAHDEESDERPVDRPSRVATPSPSEARELRRDLRVALSQYTALNVRVERLERAHQAVLGLDERDVGRLGRVEDRMSKLEEAMTKLATIQVEQGKWQWRTGALIGAIVTVALIALQLGLRWAP